MRMPLMLALILTSLSACSRQPTPDETALTFSKEIDYDYASQPDLLRDLRIGELRLPDWLKKEMSGPFHSRQFSLSALPPMSVAKTRSYQECDSVLSWHYRMNLKFGSTGIAPAKVYWLIRAAAAEHLAAKWPSQSGDEKIIFICSDDVFYHALSVSQERRNKLLADYRNYERSLNDSNRSLPAYFSKQALREQLRDLEEFMLSGYDGELLGDLRRCRAELESELQSGASDRAAR